MAVTGLSPSTLRQHLALLERDGFVHRGVARGRAGRPPIVYATTPRAQPPATETYVTLLSSLLRAVTAQGPDQMKRTVDAVAARLAAEHQDVARIPDAAARIRAALGVLFDSSEPGEVRRTDDGYEVSLYACRLAAIARDFREICDITRGLLASLVGADVVQRESILWGDPRCSFVLTIPERRPSPAPLHAGIQANGDGNVRRAPD